MCIRVCVVKSLVRTLRTLLKFLSVFKRRKPTTNYLGVLSNESKNVQYIFTFSLITTQTFIHMLLFIVLGIYRRRKNEKVINGNGTYVFNVSWM